MEHDVFISYNTRMKNVADQIVSTLEANGIKCWYAPRDVMGDYATSICDAIEAAKVFIVLLDNTGSKSPHVLNEVEMAYKRIIEDDAELTILPFKLDKEELSKAMQYYIHRMHWIDASNNNINDAIDELLQKINTILKPTKSVSPKKREANTMYEHASEQELKRLKVQERILHRFDGDLYFDYSKEFEELNVLDIGCNDGTYMSESLRHIDKPYTLLGLDFNKASIEKAQNTIKDENKTFKYANVEHEDELDAAINSYLIERGLPGFNIINISFLLLHLSNPELLLKRVRKYLVKGGYILIKDVDDNFEVAYPDANGYFEKMKELSIADSKLGGYRLTGRQIPYMLSKTGYNSIKLLKQGINTLGMDYDEKEDFFDMRFGYFEEDYTSMSESNPNDKYASSGLAWIKEHYDELEEEFTEDHFFYNFGIVLFVAKR